MGYAGGSRKNPTYYNLGDQTETIWIEFDPGKVSYSRLLDIFWKAHDPGAPPFSKQYKSVILYANEEQKRLAMETKARLEEGTKKRIYTEIVPAKEFYIAEDYHQKYYLRNAWELMKVFQEIYPADIDFVSSTAAARINGYAGGYRGSIDLDRVLLDAGLPPEAVKKIVAVLKGPRRS